MILENKDDNRLSLVISPKLAMILKNIMPEPIAETFIDNINKIDVDSSYLDVDEKNSKNVTYFPANRFDRVNSENECWSKYRQSIRWGTLINKIFPNKFSAADINSFYERYKPQFDTNQSLFEIVRGEDIRYWYHEKNWESRLDSCMRYESCQPFFDIYCNNPDKCGLLIRYSDNNRNKIVGRALIWFNIIYPKNNPRFTFMDRIYTTDKNENDIRSYFLKYAIDNNWLYKKDNFYHLNEELKSSDVISRLNPAEYKYYPYMDTMCYYTPYSGRISSKIGRSGFDQNNPDVVWNQYVLKDRHGGYTTILK